MRPLGNWLPWDIADKIRLDEIEVGDYFQPATALNTRHLQHCRVVADRTELLKTCLPARGIVAEVGTDTGAFAENVLRFAVPTRLHIIDRTLAHFRREKFARVLGEGIVRLHEADSVAALRTFPDAYFDWIYIDADHSYEGVRRDIEVAKIKVKSDGLLVFNDYVFWSHREFMAYGVVQAVNEFCVAEDWELLFLALHPEMHCDVVLRKL